MVRRAPNLLVVSAPKVAVAVAVAVTVVCAASRGGGNESAKSKSSWHSRPLLLAVASLAER